MKDNRTSVKRSLIVSAIALTLTAALLIGTTFAWFTSTATTNVSSVTAGKLQVDIVDENGASLNGQTLSFKAKDGKTDILWEPGATYSLDSFKLVNKGNLALKYKVTITGVDGNAELLNVIDFTVTKGSETAVKLADWEGVLLPDGATTTKSGEDVKETGLIKIAGKMRDDATDIYQNKSISGISIHVDATQYTYEYDSNGKDYDQNATYPDVAYAKASNSTELENILANPTDANGNPTTEVVVALDDGTYTLPSIVGKTVTISCSENTKIDMSNSPIVSAQNGGLDLTIQGATISFAGENYKGITHSKKLTLENCTINGFMTTYSDTTFTNCTFNSTANKYSINFYGGKDFDLTNCHFYGVDKNVYIYQETLDSDKNVTFTNCDFHMSGKDSTKTKSAVMVNSPAYGYDGHKYYVVLKNCTYEGGMNTTSDTNIVGNTNYQGLYGLKHNPFLIQGTVTVNDTVVYGSSSIS